MLQHPSLISIDDFNYELPEEKIAAYPLADRDQSKLLVYKNGSINTGVFSDLPRFIAAGTLLVFNNTKVIQARIKFTRGQQKAIEVFCLEPSNNRDVSMAMADKGKSYWNCLVGNLKQWKDGPIIINGGNLRLEAELLARRSNHVEISFRWDPPELSFSEVLEKTGAMPIPPYLKRSSDAADDARYQTVYAKHKGSVAAPTAGLHFTDRVLNELSAGNVERLEVTLHVGAGTFKPVKSESMAGHEMHAEWIEVSAEVIRQLMEKKERKVIAVGTTSLRTIESLYWMGVKALAQPEATLTELEVGQWDPYAMAGLPPEPEKALTALLAWLGKRNLENMLCRTSILIAPPYTLKIAEGIVTNFHQPQSTLLLLVSAIVGDQWKSIYEFALKNDFRFLSYGDSSLLLK